MKTLSLGGYLSSTSNRNILILLVAVLSTAVVGDSELADKLGGYAQSDWAKFKVYSVSIFLAPV